jgi:predicted secreted protein
VVLEYFGVADVAAQRLDRSVARLVHQLEDRAPALGRARGDSVQISLPENATTGFRWAIDRYDEEYLEAVATEPHYPENALGSGGVVSFVFRGKKLGTGEIVLKNWRHWEGDSSVTNRFRVRLRLEP